MFVFSICLCSCLYVMLISRLHRISMRTSMEFGKRPVIATHYSWMLVQTITFKRAVVVCFRFSSKLAYEEKLARIAYLLKHLTCLAGWCQGVPNNNKLSQLMKQLEKFQPYRKANRYLVFANSTESRNISHSFLDNLL